MSDSAKRDVRNLPDPTFSHSSPYGNATALLFSLVTLAGVMVDATKKTALVAADVAVLGVLPSGMRLDDCVSVISSAFTAATVLDIGFRYVDGVDDPDVPESVDYFADAMVASSTARIRNVSPDAIVTLPKEAYLIVTIAGATQDAASKLEILVNGVLTGTGE